MTEQPTPSDMAAAREGRERAAAIMTAPNEPARLTDVISALIVLPNPVIMATLGCLAQTIVGVAGGAEIVATGDIDEISAFSPDSAGTVAAMRFVTAWANSDIASACALFNAVRFRDDSDEECDRYVAFIGTISLIARASARAAAAAWAAALS